MCKLKKCLIPLIASVTLVGCSSSSTPAAPAASTLDSVDVIDSDSPPAASTLALSFAPTKAFHFSWAAVPDATSYKLIEAISTGSGYEVIEETTATSFDHVVPLYARLNAKYILESCNAGGCTASAEVFTSTKVAEMVTSIGYLKASNTDADDRFGFSVSLSADGNTLAVGAPREDSGSTMINTGQDNDDAEQTGAVYVLTRNNSGAVWSQQAYLKTSNSGRDDNFGVSVSLSADGNTLAVGASDENSDAMGVNGNQNNDSAAYAGAVYVFTRSNTAWSQQAYLKASNTDAADKFGDSVSLSADGNTLAVSAYGESSRAVEINGSNSDNEAENAGAVYVFTLSGTAWSQQAYIKASNTDAADYFGVSVSLSADGNTLAVGASGENSDAVGVNGNQNNESAENAGAVYVFTRSGTAWSQQAYLKASNTDAEDYFGYSVSLSANGNTLAVGTNGEDSNAIGINGNQADDLATSAGAVYVFTLSGTAWSQQAYIKASNADISDRFGYSVSLSADGNTLAVGAVLEASRATGINGNQNNESAENAGAVYTYTRSGATWSQQAYIKASNTGEGDQFGFSVALSSDGGTLVVGAKDEGSNATGVNADQTDNNAGYSGAVYVY